MEAREAVAQMSEEMSDVRTAALMAQTNAQEEINIASLHYNEEIRSLKLLLQGNFGCCYRVTLDDVTNFNLLFCHIFNIFLLKSST